MLVRQYLTVHSTVELHLKEGDRNSIFTVQVQDISPDGIYVNRPMIDAELFKLEPGKSMEFYFKKKDVLYYFITSIVRETRIDQLPVLLVKHPQEIKQIRGQQHKDYPYVDITIPITFQQIRNLEGVAVGTPQTGTVISLSAGGVKFSVHSFLADSLTQRTLLKLSFSILDLLTINELIAEVARIDSDTSMPSRSSIICRFLTVHPEIQEAIVAHNIQRQKLYSVERTDKRENN